MIKVYLGEKKLQLKIHSAGKQLLSRPLSVNREYNGAINII